MQNYLPSTNSKQSHRFPKGYPTEILSGEGCYVYDPKGNKYIDFMCSLGPIILGHRYEKVVDYVTWVEKNYGTSFSLSHPLERKLSDLLCEMIPSAEMVRYFHNGKDPTAAAVRLARHITGREKILSFSYHGADDTFMACTEANNGVPKCLEDTIKVFDYNELEAIEKVLKDDIACVILEPHTIRKPDRDYLEIIRELCNISGTLLIFDEIVSFPRYPKYSAQAYFGVTPDLTCISKGMANGYAISALVGKEKYMKEFKDQGVFASTTFGGNLVGVAAAIATLGEVIAKDVPDHIWKMGEFFRETCKVKTVGLPCRQFFEFESEKDRWKLMQYCVSKGIFYGIPIFFNYSMKEEHIAQAVAITNEAHDKLPMLELLGDMPREVFRKV